MVVRPKKLPPGRPRRTVAPPELQIEVLDEFPETPEFVEIDLTTDEGQIILGLTEQMDQLRAELDEMTRLRFVFRSSEGRDQDVPLPPRNAGETELVIIGAPKVDHLGRWDLYMSDPFRFQWENPANRPTPMPRCAVTGESCVHITEDFSHCRLCPGILDEQRDLLPLIEGGV